MGVAGIARSSMSAGTMTARWLIDTNVLVYAHDRSEPAKRQRAIEVLGDLHESRAGVLSTQVLGEFYAAAVGRLSARLSAAEGLAAVRRLARAWPVLPVTPFVVLEAARGVEQLSMSWWDAQVWATARMHQVQGVMSEDFQHGSVVDGVRFHDPFQDVGGTAADGTAADGAA